VTSTDYIYCKLVNARRNAFIVSKNYFVLYVRKNDIKLSDYNDRTTAVSAVKLYRYGH